MFVFFTDIVKKDVVDRRGRYVGHPHDLASNLGEIYPRVTSLIVSRGHLRKKYYVIPWKDIHQTPDGFQLKVPIESITPQRSYQSAEETMLRRSVLDQQVVDMLNRKVVRVNDMHFLRVDDDLRLAHVDIGLRGLVRRMGWEWIVDGIVRLVNRHSDYLTKEKFISWKYVQPLSIHEPTGKIKLSVEAEQLEDIPPSDVSSMLLDIDPYQRAALLRTLDVQSQVDIITELDLKLQRDLIDDLDPQAVVKIFERMPADEATDLLSGMSNKDANRILGMLSTKKSRELAELMEHESDSAGGLMTKEFITFGQSMTVAEAIEHIRTVEITKAETIHTAFVVDEEAKLVGAVSYRRLLLEPLDHKICDVMQTKPASVHVGDSVKDVAFTMDKYNLNELPAVGETGILEGIITVDDVLHVAVEEAWGRRGGL